MLNEYLVQNPPADPLIAAYLGYKAPGVAATKVQARKQNSDVIKSIPLKVVPMPAFLNTPEKRAMLQKMKEEWN